MSVTSDRSTIDHYRARKILCVIQNFPLPKFIPNGGLEFVVPFKKEKVEVIAKIISDLGDRISKESGQKILQIAQAESSKK
jgi:hypothetical protein